MFCPKCGNEITEGIKFCPKCGNQIDRAIGISQLSSAECQAAKSNLKNYVKRNSPPKLGAQVSLAKENQLIRYMILIGSIAYAISFIFPFGKFFSVYNGYEQIVYTTENLYGYIFILLGVIGIVLALLKKHKYDIIPSCLALGLFLLTKQFIAEELAQDDSYIFICGTGHALLLVGIVVSLIGSILAWISKNN